MPQGHGGRYLPAACEYAPVNFDESRISAKLFTLRGSADPTSGCRGKAKGGKKEGRKEGQKEGTKEGRNEGGGRKEERMEGRKERRQEGRGGRTEGKKAWSRPGPGVEPTRARRGSCERLSLRAPWRNTVAHLTPETLKSQFLALLGYKKSSEKIV